MAQLASRAAGPALELPLQADPRAGRWHGRLQIIADLRRRLARHDVHRMRVVHRQIQTALDAHALADRQGGVRGNTHTQAASRLVLNAVTGSAVDWLVDEAAAIAGIGLARPACAKIKL